jgi:hypothetical protein
MESCPAQTLFPAEGCPAFRSSPVFADVFKQDIYHVKIILIRREGCYNDAFVGDSRMVNSLLLILRTHLDDRVIKV